MNFVEYIEHMAGQSGWRITEVISPNLVSLNFPEDPPIPAEFVTLEGFAETPKGDTFITIRSSGSPFQFGDPTTDQVFGNFFMRELLKRNHELDFCFWVLFNYGEAEHEQALQVKRTLIIDDITAEDFRKAIDEVLIEKFRFHGLARSLRRE